MLGYTLVVISCFITPLTIARVKCIPFAHYPPQPVRRMHYQCMMDTYAYTPASILYAHVTGYATMHLKQRHIAHSINGITLF